MGRSLNATVPPGLPGGWSGGQDPGSVDAGETAADEVAQVQRGGAALEPPRFRTIAVCAANRHVHAGQNDDAHKL